MLNALLLKCWGLSDAEVPLVLISSRAFTPAVTCKNRRRYSLPRFGGDSLHFPNPLLRITSASPSRMRRKCSMRTSTRSWPVACRSACSFCSTAWWMTSASDLRWDHWSARPLFRTSGVNWGIIRGVINTTNAYKLIGYPDLLSRKFKILANLKRIVQISSLLLHHEKTYQICREWST